MTRERNEFAKMNRNQVAICAVMLLLSRLLPLSLLDENSLSLVVRLRRLVLRISVSRRLSSSSSLSPSRLVPSWQLSSSS